MHDGNAAGYVTACGAPAVEMEGTGRKIMLRLKTISWVRVIVDAILVAGILFASSSLLSVR
jgi:hypothetical protein